MRLESIAMTVIGIEYHKLREYTDKRTSDFVYEEAEKCARKLNLSSQETQRYLYFVLKNGNLCLKRSLKNKFL